MLYYAIFRCICFGSDLCGKAFFILCICLRIICVAADMRRNYGLLSREGLITGKYFGAAMVLRRQYMRVNADKSERCGRG